MGESQASKAVTAGSDGVVKIALSSSDTNVDRVGLKVASQDKWDTGSKPWCWYIF